MTAATLAQLEQEVQRLGGHSAEYWEKMMHPVPPAPVFDRVAYIVEQCKDKVVLDLGCSGPLHAEIVAAARLAHGTDIQNLSDVVENFFRADLDKAAHLPPIKGLELIVCGEVLEHLSCPGHALELLREYSCPMVVTAPNAFCEGGFRMMVQRQIENVNREHVAWYSYWTLRRLLERSEWQVKEWGWYNGKPWVAEGLVFKVE